MFYTRAELGLSVMARLPGSNDVFPLLGRPHDALDHNSDSYSVAYASYEGATYDASTTNLTYEIRAANHLNTARAVHITLSFLSPVTPTSTLRQSIPGAYLSVHVHGNDDVSIYVDV